MVVRLDPAQFHPCRAPKDSPAYIDPEHCPQCLLEAAEEDHTPTDVHWYYDQDGVMRCIQCGAEVYFLADGWICTGGCFNIDRR